MMATAAEIVPMLEDLYERLPETRRRTPFELSCYLWSLGYADDLLDEGEIGRAEKLALLRQAWPRRGAAA